MSKVTYNSKIGEYSDKVFIDIDIRVAAGLSKEDYETIRTSLEKIEDIVWKYKEIRGEEVADE